MRISDWSSDVCSSDLWAIVFGGTIAPASSTIAHVQTHPRRHWPALPARQVPQRLHLLHLTGLAPGHRHRRGDRKSVEKGKRRSVRVDTDGRRSINKTIYKNIQYSTHTQNRNRQ